tara:strand:+ start:1693 stop:1962 length:270 start_codon:yes stop_codon:yes gene_type:complete
MFVVHTTERLLFVHSLKYNDYWPCEEKYKDKLKVNVVDKKDETRGSAKTGLPEKAGAVMLTAAGGIFICTAITRACKNKRLEVFVFIYI